MSAEEKKAVVLEVFRAAEAPFSMKEIEKAAGAKKGLHPMQIKELVVALANDGKVNSAKIGVSTYYWSFPAEASVALREASERLGKQRQDLSERKAALEAQVKERNAAGGASADAECERLQAVLGDLSSKEAGLGKEVQAASACDPERYRKMKEGATTARDSANRWIENIWALESWMKKKFSGREEELKQHFKSQGVPEDMDTFQ
jgi:hypothetical protein